MNVSMWSSFFYEMNPEDAVRELKKCGFNSAELSSEHAEMLLQRGEAAVEGAGFKSFCQSENFSTPQGHFSQDGNLAAEDETEAAKVVELLKKWCDLFEAAGVRYGVLHGCTLPGQYYKLPAERTSQVAERIGKLVEYCQSKNYQLTICLENLIVNYNCWADLEELIALTPNGDALGICLDTGHLMLAQNGGHGEFIRQAGNRLKALHITDVVGEKCDHILPMVGGRCDWNEIISALKEIKYQGLFNYEIPASSFKVPLEIKKNSGKYACCLAHKMLEIFG